MRIESEATNPSNGWAEPEPEPTEADWNAYYDQCRIDGTLRDELGDRAWFALVYEGS
jgi:hypothetical protein